MKAQARPQESTLLFLPLAHIIGRKGLYGCYISGTAQGIYGGDISKLMEDLALLKPTTFVAVPRILNTIYNKVRYKVMQVSVETQALFQRALDAKIARLRRDGTVKHREHDPAVFHKIKQLLGGNLDLIVTGGAPISREELIRAYHARGLAMKQGYGQTETSAGSFRTPFGDNRVGHVG